ncbi:MAG TPA: carboxylic ester hydrolase [Actinomycetes bacterium]|nr:carboxylic ester hydrolase [Actinomycetes bacterium]
MRPLEILLLVADLVAFLLLVVPLPGRARGLRRAAPIVLLAMGAQLLVEGPRWQLVPAYALAGLFFLVWLLQTVKPAGRPTGRSRTRRLAAGLGVGLGVLGLAVAVALPIVLPVFGFPHPTGQYAIGTVTYHWVDAGRPEVFTADPHDRRELMVQLWYPAKADPSAPRAAYIQDADAVAPALARAFHLPGFAFGHFKYITTNAIPSAPVAADQASYPALIFLHGFSGLRQHNTFQVEELVSHGYIVAAIDQPYAAALVVFPDGRQAVGLSRDQMKPLVRASYTPVETAPTLNGQTFNDGIVPYLAQDARLTLDQLAALNQADPNGILTGRLDLQRAGIFGISLGGIVGAETCRLEPRLRACLVLDAPMPTDVVQAGLQQPTMWITRDAETMRLEGWPKTEIDEHQTTMRAVFQSLPGDGYFVRVRGMFHLNLTDYPLVSPLMPLTGITGPIGAQRAHRIISAYPLAFFDRHLKGRPATLLDGPAAQYPDVALETRRPFSAH